MIRGRRAFAVPAALAALVIIALFIAGSAFFSLQEARSAGNGVVEQRAVEAAEYGAAATLRDWDPSWNTSILPGVTMAPATWTLSGGALASVRMTRLTPTLFWVVSEGTAGGMTARFDARRRLGAALRLDVTDPPVSAALIVRDSVEVRGTGQVAGTDSLGGAPRPVPPACAAAGPAVAGVASPDTTRTCDGGCGAPAGVRITGVPARLTELAAGDSLRYQSAAAGQWAAVARRASVVLPANATITPAPVVAAGACQGALPTNWGDPGGSGPCAEYLPVIHALGDVTMSGGTGQGILLVEGDLRLAGGATFTGLVVVTDDITTVIGGGRIIGAALAGDARTGAGDHSVIGDGGVVRWSSCAVARALYGAARPRRVRGWWWADMP